MAHGTNFDYSKVPDPDFTRKLHAHLDRVNEMREANPDRVYRSTVNHSQMLMIIMGLEKLVERFPDVLSEIAVPEAGETGLSTAAELLDMLKETANSTTHKNSMHYGFTL